jgi:microcin C transport system substrate-binding protein
MFCIQAKNAYLRVKQINGVAPAMILTRRSLGKLSALAGILGVTKIVGMSVAYAQEKQFLHATSLFGDVKYPPDFKHFAYVNPNAPKGGRLRLHTVGSFDSLNPFTYKGESSGYGAISTEALMTSSLDEPSTMYGLIANEVWYPEDFSQVVYRLRAEARFHDGKPVTPEDVIWSMTALKEVSPQNAFYYKNVTKAEQTGEREITFLFSEKGNRELPHIVGQLNVLPKHWWTGTDRKGAKRNIAEMTLEAPLGSGAYEVADVKVGNSIRVRRFTDYWGKDLAINVGQDNFDEIELIYFRDANVALEAFKGDQYDWRNESSAKNWATGYDVPAVKSGRIKKEEIRTKNADGMQGFVLNLRRPKFQDPRVRLALNYAFDFEWANTNLFYGQYTRSSSYFNGSELAATGLPSAAELAILNEVKNDIPAEVFTTEFKNPVNRTPQDVRSNLRMAAKLFAEAGWKISQEGSGGAQLKSESGEIFAIEFLLDQPLWERITLPYKEQLLKLGIRVTIRTIDSAEMERRGQTFDYDSFVHLFPQSLSPGNEQRYFWGSAAADLNGSQNYMGIKNPAIDKLIERVVFAKDRDDLIAATRALDRVLLWNHYLVPHWYIPVERVARWDRFGSPDKLPDYAVGFPTIWWWDEEKAKKTAAAK